MPTAPAGLDAARVVKERLLIEEAQRDLCAAFPWLPVERVRVVLECLWAEYDDAHIRDFISVLVRKQAREVLRDQFHTEAPGGGPMELGVNGAWPCHGALSRPS